ncbi:MAG TPA: FAD-dependent oxidoreductase, partial [Pirellulales bacterium]|nr:FAD-dependent oxidoreductase [Pirellulales bacterium]
MAQRDQDRMGHHKSAWSDLIPTAGESTALRSGLETDVCVVGAGIAGLSVAWHLARAGKKICVLDDGPIGSGQTVRTTAHLSNAIDDRYIEIERIHGLEVSRLAAESHTAAIHRIESIVKAENIDCDFVRLDGYLFVPPGEDPDILEDELAAAHRAGLSDVELIARCPAAPFDTGRCLRFPLQAQFNPLKYLRGLKDAIERDGGQIFSGAHVKSVEGGSPCTVKTRNGHTVTAENVVVATNTPINDMYAIHTKQAPYMSYVVGLRVDRGALQPALLWDTHDPYHYVRVQPMDDYDLLIVGGEDQKTATHDDAADRYDRLEQWARERWPMAGTVEFRWSGQVMETIDGLAFIGRNPSDDPHVYIATGDSGMGMTHGTIAGILISDLIMGRDNPW